LREKVAGEAGRMSKGSGAKRQERTGSPRIRLIACLPIYFGGADPSSVAFGDTFSRKGRRRKPADVCIL
jgi:hypothetical protein